MKRRIAREIAVQSLYQIQMNEATPQEAVQIAIHEAEHDNETQLDFSGEKIDPVYIIELVEGTYSNKVRIDELLEEYLKGWAMDRLSRIDREVLRLGAYEMLYEMMFRRKLLSMRPSIWPSIMARMSQGNS